MGHLLTLNDQPLEWAELHLRRAAYWRRGQRRNGPQRADKQLARGVRLTDKGRAVLREMRVAS